MSSETKFGETSFRFERRFVRIARLSTEWWKESSEPEAAIQALKEDGEKADLFTFIQRPPDLEPRYDYPLEWEEIAALPLTTYDAWWNDQIRFRARNKARKAEKKGVEIRVAPYDDDFVRGIKHIYDETPIRQDRPFPHFEKEFEVVKAEHATYGERSSFIGAYYEGEMIGFIKLVFDEHFASLMEILSMIRHRDKAPTNALLAKAIELCTERGLSYLTYSLYTYGNKGEDGLTEFKKSNAFEPVAIPRYYVPLSLKGRIALRLGLHKGLKGLIPRPVTRLLLRVRHFVSRRRAPVAGE